MSDNDDTAMSGGSFTEITTQSWFSRIAQSFAGLIVGPILVLVGIGVLVWNEDRAVTTARSLIEGQGAVITVDATAPLSRNDGHLVHVTGLATTTAKLSDADFGVSVPALTLHRQVEMMQWKEHEETRTEKNLGGSETKIKTYTYTREWSVSPVDSARFKHPEGHANPAFAVSGRDSAARDARLGGFRLADKLLLTLPANDPVPVEAAAIDGLKVRLGRPASALDGGIFVGADPTTPKVGDLKIAFKQTPLGDLTVIAAQAGNGFSGYQTKAGDTLEEIRQGSLTPQQIFAQMASDNAVLTWILRAVGAVLVLIGFSVFFAPISVLADFIPLLGSLVGFGTGFLAFMLTFTLVPVTIALAWLAFRPLVSVGVLAVGAVCLLAVRFLWPARRSPTRTANAPPPMPARP